MELTLKRGRGLFTSVVPAPASPSLSALGSHIKPILGELGTGCHLSHLENFNCNLESGS